MPIPAHCQCGAKFAAPDHLAGKSVACPTCKQPLKIPAAKPSGQSAAKKPAAKQAVAQKAPAQKAAPPQAAAGKIAVKCQCGGSFAAPAKLAGKRVACPQCKQPVEIPAAKQKAAAPASRPSQPANSAAASGGGGLDDLLEEVGVEGKKVGESYCPECSAPFPEEALLCVQCGYNRKTGRKISTVKVKKPPSKAVDLTAPPGGLKTFSTAEGYSSTSNDAPSWLKPVKIGLLAVVMLAFVGSLLFPPTAMLLVLTGALLGSVSSLRLLGIAFQDDIIQGLLVWLIPFYFLIYIAQNWEETKLVFWGWVIGLLMIVGGVAMFMIATGVHVALFGES